jgi:hypothetical protein
MQHQIFLSLPRLGTKQSTQQHVQLDSIPGAADTLGWLYAIKKHYICQHTLSNRGEVIE